MVPAEVRNPSPSRKADPGEEDRKDDHDPEQKRRAVVAHVAGLDAAKPLGAPRDRAPDAYDQAVDHAGIHEERRKARERPAGGHHGTTVELVYIELVTRRIDDRPATRVESGAARVARRGPIERAGEHYSTRRDEKRDARQQPRHDARGNLRVANDGLEEMLQGEK